MGERLHDASGRLAMRRRRAAHDDPLFWVRRIAYVVLSLKLAAFASWSVVLFRHFSLTPDFAQYQQAWYLIAHGDLNPYDTVGYFAFWQNHAEFIMWPLALLYWVFPNGVVLLWLQDIGVVGAELVAFTWLCEIALRYRAGRDARWLAGAGLVLLAINPWSWWAVSFDFHAECLAVLFIALLSWDLANGRRRAWVWAAAVLACGDVAGTYVLGLGLGLLITSRNSRRRGALLAGLGAGALLLVTAIHGNLGSGHGLQAYDYLAPGYNHSLGLIGLVMGIATHPFAVLARLWTKRLDLWANLASSGFLGLAYLPLLPLMMVVVVSNSLFVGDLFSEPLFQSLPVYVLMPVATVGALGWLTRRHRRAGLLAAAVVVAQAIGWSAVWAPQNPVAMAAGARTDRGDAGRRRGAHPGIGCGIRFPGGGRPLRHPVRRAPAERAPADPSRSGLVRLHPVGRHRNPDNSGRDGVRRRARRPPARHARHRCQRCVGLPLESAAGDEKAHGRPRDIAAAGVDGARRGGSPDPDRAARRLARDVDWTSRVRRRPARMAAAARPVPGVGDLVRERPGQRGDLE